MRSIFFMTLLLTAQSIASAASLPGPYNSARNTYWPMTPGNRWIYRNPNPGGGKEVPTAVVMSIRPSPEMFGGAAAPVYVRIDKTRAEDYWCVGYEANLHWFLGVQTNGDIIGFGHFWTNFQGINVSTTDNYRSHTAGKPAYMLIRGQYIDNELWDADQVYPSRVGTFWDANPETPGMLAQHWHVQWTRAYVSTPGYTGMAVKASYNEGNGNYIEDWYFAQGVGVVKIQSLVQGGAPIPGSRVIELVAYEPQSLAYLRGPEASLRDQVIAASARTSGLNFYQWNWYYNKATGVSSPDPGEVCSNSTLALNNITASEYQRLMNRRGLNCSTISLLDRIEQRAGRYEGLSFDQWNYFYTLETGKYGPSPEAVCYDPAKRANMISSGQWYRYIQGLGCR